MSLEINTHYFLTTVGRILTDVAKLLSLLYLPVLPLYWIIHITIISHKERKKTPY